MAQPRGVSLPLSLPRRLVCDLLHFAKKTPSVPVERHMNLLELVRAREVGFPKPSWCALFTKAWGMTCLAHPELRRLYFDFPFQRLYQHPITVALVPVERPYGDERAVFTLQLSHPESRSLVQIDQDIKHFKNCPLGARGSMRRQLLVARQPRFIRRLLWWLAANLTGPLRARFLGTFSVSVYSGLGATSLHPVCIGTSALCYGVIQPDGSVPVRVSYDHRVLDGADVARALATLERILKHEILAEVRYLESVDRPQSAA